MVYCLETKSKHCQPVSKVPEFFKIFTPLVLCSPLHLVKEAIGVGSSGYKQRFLLGGKEVGHTDSG